MEADAPTRSYEVASGGAGADSATQAKRTMVRVRAQRLAQKIYAGKVIFNSI
jgi:hypothetical protein